MAMEEEINSTRSSLLERIARSPDDPGWADFDHLYRGFLRRICVEMGLSEEDAKDISQEVLADLVKKLPEFSYDRERGFFRGWLRQRVRWKVLDAAKGSSAKIGARSMELAEIEAEGSSPEFDALWDREWHTHLLATARESVKQKVSVRSFQVYDLLTAKELPVKEVAGIFGITENHVYKIRHEVETKLKEELTALGGDLG